jgi:hypothetical protein
MDRPTTDGAYGICFLVFFVAWLGIVIYAFSTGDFETAFQSTPDVPTPTQTQSLCSTTACMINAARHGGHPPAKEIDNFQTFYNVLTSLTACIVFTQIYIILMSKFTKTLCYISIFFVESFFVAIIGLCAMSEGGIISAIILGIFFLILNFFLFTHFAQMNVAIAVIGVAADFYGESKRIVFISLFYFIIHLVCFGATLVACMLLIPAKKK